MTDNVVNFRAPKELMPARWRRHSDIMRQTAREIDALRKRLYEEMRAFLNVMQDDMCPESVSPERKQAMRKATLSLDKGVRDAMTLLECASERVGYAAPSDFEFEYAPSKPAS